MEILKNTRNVNIVIIILVAIHTLVLYACIFHTDKLDTNFGPIGFLIALALGILVSCIAFEIKVPFRYPLLISTLFMFSTGAVLLFVFLTTYIN